MCGHDACFCDQVLADQDWISFRPNVFALQDLASKWIETIKARLAEAQRADTVTEHVHQVRNAVTPLIGSSRCDALHRSHEITPISPLLTLKLVLIAFRCECTTSWIEFNIIMHHINFTIEQSPQDETDDTPALYWYTVDMYTRMTKVLVHVLIP